MKTIKKISSHRWDHTLYEVEGSYVLTVVFFGGIDYPRSFRLSEKEINSDLKLLSEKIRNTYDDFVAIEIKPPIIKATIA